MNVKLSYVECKLKEKKNNLTSKRKIKKKVLFYDLPA